MAFEDFSMIWGNGGCGAFGEGIIRGEKREEKWKVVVFAGNDT